MGRKWECPHCGTEWEETEDGEWESEQTSVHEEQLKSASGEYCRDCVLDQDTEKTREDFLLGRMYPYQMMLDTLIEVMHPQDVDRVVKLIKVADPELYNNMIFETIFRVSNDPMADEYIEKLMEEN